MILNAILIASVIIYCAGLFWFLAGLKRDVPCLHDDKPMVSVVVAARNEARTIGRLLADLHRQTYPSDKMEIIIAEDRSDDNTADVVTSWIERDSRIRLVPVRSEEPGLSAKKNAMQTGIDASGGDIILTTDADCRVRPGWVASMVACFGPDVGMVIGFSQIMTGTGRLRLFEKIQALDFLALMTSARGSANQERAQAASGQNLAYRREAFHDAGGFRPIGHRISGDDVLLLQLLRRKTRWKVRFAAGEESFNQSPPEPDLRSYLNQRTRWASNGIYQFKLNKWFFLYVLNTYVINLLILVTVPWLVISGIFPAVTLFCYGLKGLCEWMLLSRGCDLFRRTDLLTAFPAWCLFQVPYVVFVGLAGTVGRFSWKGRKHGLIGRRSS